LLLPCTSELSSIVTISTTLLSRGTNTRDDGIEVGIEGQEEIEHAPVKNYRGVLQVSGAFYLNLKGLIKINNRATLETLPLEEGLQFFITFWNEGTNRANIFGLAMIQDRLN